MMRAVRLTMSVVEKYAEFVISSQHHPPFLTSSPLILISDVATMVAWSLKKKEAEKKPDPKAAALPFYKRFTRKQTLLGLLIFSLILSVLAVVTWYAVYQLELLPAGVHASFHTLATTFLISQGMGTGGQVENV